MAKPDGSESANEKQGVDQRAAAAHGRDLVGELDQMARQPEAAAQEALEVRLEQHAGVELVERCGALAEHGAHHLLGGDAVGDERGDERAGGGAEVDVELVDVHVHREQIEGAQCADRVDAAGHASASEHEGDLRAAAAACRGALGHRLEGNDSAHRYRRF